MKSYKLAVLAVLFLFLVPIATAVDCISNDAVSPEYNRTYPYSTNLQFLLNPIAPSDNCTYEIIWYGDESGHGDWSFPEFTYGPTFDSTGQLFGADGLTFDVDFDGKYAFNATCNLTIGGQQNECIEFFVDREELDSSKPLTALGIVFGIIAMALVFFYMGNNLDDRHAAIKLYLNIFPVVLIVLSGFVIHAIEREYLKVLTIHNSVYILTLVLTWGGLVVIFFYFMLHLIKTFLEMLRIKRQGKDNDFEDGF